MNSQQRFELLSAYLDRELTTETTEEVERWLIRDQQARKTYRNLLQLRYHIRRAPVYSSQGSSEALAKKVVSKATHQTLKQGLFWGGGTIAALFITMISGVFSWSDPPLSRLAKSSESNVPSDSLMIVIDQPVVEIPIVPVSTSSQTQEQSSSSSESNP
jgi:anti-sigma factor RsiW